MPSYRTDASPTPLGSATLTTALRQDRDRTIDDAALYNQTDLISKFRTGSLEHTLVTGMELGRDRFDEDRYSWTPTNLPVNLAEALIRIRDRQPTLAGELQTRLLGSGIHFVPPDQAQAVIAARARHQFPLNLGDCFAYALAVSQDCEILTLDDDFRKTDRPILLPPPTR